MFLFYQLVSGQFPPITNGKTEKRSFQLLVFLGVYVFVSSSWKGFFFVWFSSSTCVFTGPALISDAPVTSEEFLLAEKLVKTSVKVH